MEIAIVTKIRRKDFGHRPLPRATCNMSTKDPAFIFGGTWRKPAEADGS